MEYISIMGDKLGECVGRLAELVVRYYRVLLILGLVFFIFIDCYLVMPAYRDLGVNLLTDSIFTIFTIIFLMALIEFRENHQWKLVEDQVKDIIAERLQSVIHDLILLSIGTDEGYTHVTMEVEVDKMKPKVSIINYKLVLEALREIELNENTKKKMLEGTMNSLGRALENHVQALSDVQVQYFRFLDAELLRAIMQIQEDLRMIRRYMRTLAHISGLSADSMEARGLFALTAAAIRHTAEQISEADERLVHMPTIWPSAVEAS